MSDEENNNFQDADFKPRGAVVFLVLLLQLAALIWFGIYFLMLNRV